MYWELVISQFDHALQLCMFTVSQKSVHLLIVESLLQRTNFNDFWYMKSSENFTSKAYKINLSTSWSATVATLLLEICISHFNSTANTYFWLFALSQNKTNCNHDCKLAQYIWNISLHYLVKCRTCLSDWTYIVFLKMLSALKRSRNGCDVWQLARQAMLHTKDH